MWYTATISYLFYKGPKCLMMEEEARVFQVFCFDFCLSSMHSSKSSSLWPWCSIGLGIMPNPESTISDAVHSVIRWQKRAYSYRVPGSKLPLSSSCYQSKSSAHLKDWRSHVSWENLRALLFFCWFSINTSSTIVVCSMSSEIVYVTSRHTLFLRIPKIYVSHDGLIEGLINRKYH